MSKATFPVTVSEQEGKNEIEEEDGYQRQREKQLLCLVLERGCNTIVEEPIYRNKKTSLLERHGDI